MPDTDVLIRAAAAALHCGDIRANSELALRIQLAAAALENERLYEQIERLYEQIEALEARLAEARAGSPDEIARLEAELSRADAAWGDEMFRARRAARWAAAWKHAAKHQRRMEREIEAAVERRDERIRIQDATITELVAHRDRLMAELADVRAARAEPVPFEPDHRVCRECKRDLPRDAYAPGAWKKGLCRACKSAQNKRYKTTGRTSPAPQPAPEPEPEPDPVAAAWSEELRGLYRCPQCQRLAFAQALRGDMCVKCAAERKAA